MGFCGDEVGRSLKGTGIEEVRTAFGCSWQNPLVERDVGILRRELLDNVLVLNAEHLTRLLEEFVNEYYHIAWPHYGLEGETLFPTNMPEPEAPAVISGGKGRSARRFRLGGQ